MEIQSIKKPFEIRFKEIQTSEVRIDESEAEANEQNFSTQARSLQNFPRFSS